MMGPRAKRRYPRDKSVRVCPCVCLGSAAPSAASQSVRVHARASVSIVRTVRTMACAAAGMRFLYCITNASANSNCQLHFSLETSAELANDLAVALFQSLTFHMLKEPPPVKFSRWQKTTELSMTRKLAWWLVRSFLQLSNCHMSQHYPNQKMSRQLQFSGVKKKKGLYSYFVFAIAFALLSHATIQLSPRHFCHGCFHPTEKQIIL